MSLIQINNSDQNQKITSRSKVMQIVDIVQSDIANVDSDGLITNTRRKYEVFVTGGLGLNGVTSSLYQTVYDQDFTLQTSNGMFDITVGLFQDGTTVTDCSTGADSSGKLLFPSQSLMMREKINMYRQYAQTLLGDADLAFHAPFGEIDAANQIDEAVFLNFRRLFVRDNIHKGTWRARIQPSVDTLANAQDENLYEVPTTPNSSIILGVSPENNDIIIHPIAGELGIIRPQEDTTQSVGILFYDRGIAVLDAAKVFTPGQQLRGVISSINPNAYTKDTISVLPGQEILDAPFIPNLWQSGSIDDIVDHIAGTRFLNGNSTGIAFQNATFINSSLIFCTAKASHFNYSTNPTFTDENGQIRVINPDADDTEKPFTYVTTVGLYNAAGELLAVAKTSRPIEKNPETELSIRVRLDY